MPRNKKNGSKAAKNQITKPVPANNDANENDENKKLTPYQGSRQTFGMFKCQKCNRYWTSNVSWANCGQMCKKCKIFVYPFRQIPLDSEKSKKLDKSDSAKNHAMELCEKCRILGRYCGRRFQKSGR